jgi:hypothetical protein
MAGRHGVKAQAESAFVECVELEVTVALNTGIGRAPGQMVGDEGVHDVAVEVVGEVENVVIDPENLGDPTSVVDVAHRTTARVADPTRQLERGPNDLVALTQKQGGGHRGVDSPTHRDQYFHPFSLPVSTGPTDLVSSGVSGRPPTRRPR